MELGMSISCMLIWAQIVTYTLLTSSQPASWHTDMLLQYSMPAVQISSSLGPSMVLSEFDW